MKQKLNWFFVETPLQVINAIEALKYLTKADEKNILVIKNPQSNEVRAQIDEVLKFLKQDNLEIILIGKTWPSLYFLRVMILFFRMLGHIGHQNYFIGEFNSFWMRLLTFVFTKSEYTLFDDGAATINLHYFKYDFSKYPTHSRVVKAIKTPIFKVLNKGAAKIRLFTMFNLKPYDNQEIFYNNFDYLKSLMIDIQQDSEHIYLIGTDFVEAKWMKKGQYLKCINTAINGYIEQGKTIIYMPHRNEKLEKLKPIKKQYGDAFNIVQPKMPIEMYFLHQKIKPLFVVGFGSTALYTLGKMFNPQEVVSYVLFMDEVKDKYLPLMNQVLEHFENSGFIECRKLK